ncbi:hypothetical protein HDR58_05815, partial [bacterium]|nr:hypothetical protein [bacterium]
MPDVELNTEYSVSEFKRAYYKIFGEQVLPILVKYEDERKFRLKGAIVAMVIFAVLIVFCFFNVHGKAGGQLVGILCAVAVLFW